MYEYEWTCRWDHVDPANFAYYPELINACHQAGDAFLEEIGWAYWDIPQDPGIHFPLVEVGFDFNAPVMASDRVVISVDPNPGTKSLRFEFTAKKADSGDVVFTGFEQHVCTTSEHPIESTEIPDAMREALAPYVTEDSA